MDTSKSVLLSVAEQLTNQHLERSERVALRHGDRSLSYGELYAAGRQFAAYLTELNIAPGSTVAICMERSSDWITAALGVMLAGSAYVPLDSTWPEARLQFALRDSAATALVARPQMLEQLQGDLHRIDPSRDQAAIAAAPKQSLEPVDLDSLAYIIYTSGSTGTPKGVEITHRNLAHLVKWHLNAFGITSNDRASHLAGLGFDAAVWEIWSTLAAGATLCLADDAVRSSPELIQAWLLREAMTVSFVPTVHAAPLMGMVWPANTPLRILLTGGEALLHAPPKKLPFLVINNYGPTECTVVASSGVVPVGSAERPPIGRPIAGTHIYLLGEDGRPVQDGAVGELYIGGEGVGRGYRNLPDATAAAFVPDPLSGVPGARMYRSGDRGIRRADGEIEFRGRADRQVKIRGYRIELDEISAILAQQPQVAFATTVVRQSARQEDQIVAYLLQKDDSPLPTVKELQEWVKQSLPEYMVPSVFARLDSIPVSANGKIDLAMLPPPSDDNVLERRIAKAAKSDTERELLALAQDLLEQPTLTTDENFFLAGGHSLLSMQLILKLRKLFGVDLALSELFGAPTVELLTVIVDRKQAEKRIRAIWINLLGVQDIDLKTSFFAMPGTALLLDSLQQRIQTELGRTFTLDELAANDTISKQASMIQEKEPTAAQPLPLGVLPLRITTTRTPIFWVHYLSANLARAIPEEQPFIHVGLVTEDLLALGDKPSLPAVAACFVAKVLATQPHGPFVIGGSCLGGILAYEISSQLKSSGEDVPLLVMIDTPSPSYFKSRGVLTPKLRHPRYLLKRARRIGLRSSYLRVQDRFTAAFDKFLGKKVPMTDTQVVQHLIESAASSYQAKGYAGKVALILAADHPPHIDFLSEWSTLIPDHLHAQYLAAHHSELMSSVGVQSVANAITSMISSSADATATSAPASYGHVESHEQVNKGSFAALTR